MTKRIKANKKKKILNDAINLDYSFCNFIIPRLRCYIDNHNGWRPADLELKEWNKILKEMLEGFEFYHIEYYDYYHVEDIRNFPLEKVAKFEKIKSDKINRSLNLFKEYFTALWI